MEYYFHFSFPFHFHWFSFFAIHRIITLLLNLKLCLKFSILHFSIGIYIRNFGISESNFACLKKLSPPREMVGNGYKSSFRGFGVFLRAPPLRFWKKSFLTILHWICLMCDLEKKIEILRFFCIILHGSQKKAKHLHRFFLLFLWSSLIQQTHT